MLNQYQVELIEAIVRGGIVIGEACPGSGKTRTMEEAVSRLINQENVSPSRIGVFTFSRKSAAEARRRITKTIIPDISEEELKALESGSDEAASDVWGEADPKREMIRNWVCTIHGLSFRLLKANGVKVRMPDKKQGWEVQNIIKDGIKELDWDESPKSVWYWISQAINNMVDLRNAKGWFHLDLNDQQARNMAELYRRYITFMNNHGLVDFDMMQAKVVELIRNDMAFCFKLSKMFDYIFVDEAQDNNDLQNVIIRALAQNANLVMIGDVDQALYSFRGAVPDVLRSIENATRLNLPINYRSTVRIVESSARLIAYSYGEVSCKENVQIAEQFRLSQVNGIDEGQYSTVATHTAGCSGISDEMERLRELNTNPGQTSANFLKPFQSRPDAPLGNEISFVETKDFQGLVSEIVALIGDDTKDTAILSRTRAECAAIHTGLVAAGIPAINHSGGLLFGSPHIRKVIAYAMLACDYNGARDNLEILTEIANVASVNFVAPMTRRRHSPTCTAKPWQDCGCPIVIKEGEGPCHTRFYGAKAIEEAGSWQGILDQRRERNRGGYSSLNSKGASDLVQFVERLSHVKDNAYGVLTNIIEDSVKPWLMAEEGLSDEDLAENGKAEDFALLLEMAETGMTLEQFLDKIEWLSKQAQSSNNAVNIGTIHWSKGAEFDRVIVNLTRCPLTPPKQDPEKLPVGRPPTTEEERRLAFVAVSRAKSECFVVNSLDWLGQPMKRSQFISELKG